MVNNRNGKQNTEKNRSWRICVNFKLRCFGIGEDRRLLTHGRRIGRRIGVVLGSYGRRFWVIGLRTPQSSCRSTRPSLRVGRKDESCALEACTRVRRGSRTRACRSCSARINRKRTSAERARIKRCSPLSITSKSRRVQARWP